MTDIATYSSSNGRGFGVVAEPALLRIADYWASIRGDRALPRRNDVDPLDIPWALPEIFLVDYDRELETYRYRVAGSEIEAVFKPFTGRNTMRSATLQTMLPRKAAALVHERWRPLAENGDIVYMSGLIYHAADRTPIGSRILLPLSDRDDLLPTGLLGFTRCEWIAPSDLPEPPGLSITYIPLAETIGYRGNVSGAPSSRPEAAAAGQSGLGAALRSCRP